MEEERRRMVEEEKERARQAEIDRLKPAYVAYFED